MKIVAIGKTDIGSVRENNEDNFAILDLDTSQTGDISTFTDTSKGVVLIVADGMGGAVAGETASATLVNESIQFITSNLDEPIDLLPTLCMHASQKKCHELIDNNHGLAGMGTVATIAIIKDDTLHISQIGDTRLYIFRNKTLEQITEDQNFVSELVKLGIITKEQAQIHPQRNAVTQAVGSLEPILPVDYTETIREEDYILICSDGLNSMITDLEIQLVLEKESSLIQKVDELIESAKEAGGHDNITVILAKVIA
jgi:protein phosphatase